MQLFCNKFLNYLQKEIC